MYIRPQDTSKPENQVDSLLKIKKESLSNNPELVLQQNVRNWLREKTGLNTGRLQVDKKGNQLRVSGPAALKQYLIINQVVLLDDLGLRDQGIKKII